MNRIVIGISCFGHWAQKNIDKVLFFVSCSFVVLMCILGVANKIALNTMQDYLTQRRRARDQEIAEIKSQLSVMIADKTDHRYRDTDAARDFAKRDAEIKALEDKLEDLKTKVGGIQRRDYPG
jgi:uncharacterized protein YlxW (UPF0749 family)